MSYRLSEDIYSPLRHIMKLGSSEYFHTKTVLSELRREYEIQPSRSLPSGHFILKKIDH